METTTTRSIAEIEAELSAAREAEAQRKRDEQKMQEKLERALGVKNSQRYLKATCPTS